MDIGIKHKSENDLAKDAFALELLIKNGDASFEDANRLDEIRTALKRIREVKKAHHIGR